MKYILMSIGYVLCSYLYTMTPNSKYPKLSQITPQMAATAGRVAREQAHDDAQNGSNQRFSRP